MRVSRQRGVAMVLALMALLLVAGIGTLLFARTISEMNHSRDDAAIVQTLLLARGGLNVGGALLGSDVNDRLREVVRTIARPGPWIFGDGAGEQPNASSVIADLNIVASNLQPRIDALVCDQVIVPTGEGGEVRIRIHFTNTACGEALPDSVRLPPSRYVSGPRRGAEGIGVQTYALPFVMIAEASVGEYRRNIVTQGEYQFEMGQASFALYAYFTDRETTATSGRIWFTDFSMIDGPVHTNGNFAFAYDPWFGGRVSSAGCQNSSCTSIEDGAYLYRYRHTEEYNCRTVSDWEYYRDSNGGWVQSLFGGWTEYNPWLHRGRARYSRRPVERRVCSTRQVDLVPGAVLGNAPSFGGNAPVFAGGVAWDSPSIDLPDNHYRQRDLAQGVDRHDEGLYFNDALYSLELFAGTNATFNGNMNSVLQTRTGDGEWQPPATYQYVRACTSSESNSCTVYRIDHSGTVEIWDAGSGAFSVRPSGRRFNGVIFVNGETERFTGPGRSDSSDGLSAPPAIAAFSEITLASDSNIRITGDIRYESPPCSSRPIRNEDRSVTPAQCNNLNATNVLGVYTQGGEVRVGHGHGSNSSRNAPDDVHVHAVLMSAEKEIRVENHDSGDSGSFFLMGGMIQNTRGIFGTFSGSGEDADRTGYDRVYTYDPRMARGVAPPFFPSTNLDDVTNVSYFTFGQREQLYVSDD